MKTIRCCPRCRTPLEDEYAQSVIDRVLPELRRRYGPGLPPNAVLVYCSDDCLNADAMEHEVFVDASESGWPAHHSAVMP